MRFLADESCDGHLVTALRVAGHDIESVADSHQGTDDATVIRLAVDQQRILLTEDKDFGQLVFAAGRGHTGVILLRYPFGAREHITQELVTLSEERADILTSAFVVIEPGRIRILKR
ncbi:MAG: DUF5615 family PIN-like protein [Kiritimatiellae bacterium]|nr:DUF5615 family PIN-like protein [Kiritimatiellia bacterium]